MKMGCSPTASTAGSTPTTATRIRHRSRKPRRWLEIHMQSGNTYRMRIADGISNTSRMAACFGMAFDPLGNTFGTDCDTEPIYCISAGRIIRASASPRWPWLRPEHDLERRLDGLRRRGDKFPAEYRDTMFIGNPVTHRITTSCTARRIGRKAPTISLRCDDHCSPGPSSGRTDRCTSPTSTTASSALRSAADASGADDDHGRSGGSSTSARYHPGGAVAKSPDSAAMSVSQLIDGWRTRISPPHPRHERNRRPHRSGGRRAAGRTIVQRQIDADARRMAYGCPAAVGALDDKLRDELVVERLEPLQHP